STPVVRAGAEQRAADRERLAVPGCRSGSPDPRRRGRVGHVRSGSRDQDLYQPGCRGHAQGLRWLVRVGARPPGTRPAKRSLVLVHEPLADTPESVSVGRKWFVGVCQTVGAGPLRMARRQRSAQYHYEAGRTGDAGERLGPDAGTSAQELDGAHGSRVATATLEPTG